jgi:hypothetical protein
MGIFLFVWNKIPISNIKKGTLISLAFPYLQRENSKKSVTHHKDYRRVINIALTAFKVCRQFLKLNPSGKRKKNKSIFFISNKIPKPNIKFKFKLTITSVFTTKFTKNLFLNNAQLNFPLIFLCFLTITDGGSKQIALLCREVSMQFVCFTQVGVRWCCSTIRYQLPRRSKFLRVARKRSPTRHHIVPGVDFEVTA